MDGAVFPAGAGMNRKAQAQRSCLSSVPRRRGDEPVPGVTAKVGGRCSPQARG